MQRDPFEEIRRFDPELPIEAASTPPAEWYNSPEILELERERVFAHTWQPVARLDQLKSVGQYVAGEWLGEPFVVVRTDPEQLRALSPVCAHHAAILARGEGCVEQWVCPYHGWTYALDGRLLRARGAGGIQDFERSRFALAELPLAIFGELVCIAWEAPSEPIVPLSAHAFFGADAAKLCFVEQRSYVVRSNWKVVIDNYLDGGYHVPVLHRSLAASLDLDSYATEVRERVVVQTTAADPASGDPRLGEGATYAWIYPTWMLNRYGPLLDVNRVVPIDVGTTRVIYDFYVSPEVKGDRAFVEASLRESERIQTEDTLVCESVQTGLGSRAYDRGRYAPRFERGAHHFHCMLARDLLRADTVR